MAEPRQLRHQVIPSSNSPATATPSDPARLEDRQQDPEEHREQEQPGSGAADEPPRFIPWRRRGGCRGARPDAEQRIVECSHERGANRGGASRRAPSARTPRPGPRARRRPRAHAELSGAQRARDRSRPGEPQHASPPPTALRRSRAGRSAPRAASSARTGPRGRAPAPALSSARARPSRKEPREPLQELDGQLGPEGIETRRLPGRGLGGQRRHGSHAVGPPVEALEDHRPSRDRPGRRQTERRNGPGDLDRHLRNTAGCRFELCPSLMTPSGLLRGRSPAVRVDLRPTRWRPAPRPRPGAQSATTERDRRRRST